MIKDVQAPSIRSLIDRQVVQWQWSRAKPTPWRAAPLPVLRVVTLSRQVASHGRSLAYAVAQTLGFDVFDREIVERIASSSSSQAFLVEILDEKERSLVEDTLFALLDSSRITHDQYCEHLLRVLLAVHQQGRAVILGRGANFALPSDTCLRVRTVCPFEVRVERLCTKHALERHAAESLIRDGDESRRRFVKKLYGADVNDPTHYDLVIDTSNLDGDDACEVVLSAYRAKTARVARAQTKS